MSRPQSSTPSSDGVCEAFAATIRHFFPLLWTWVDKLDDPRKNPKKCQYTQRILVATALCRCFACLKSHREMDSMFNGEGDAIKENLFRLTGHRTQAIPRGQTLNYWLSKLSPGGLKDILDSMAMQLLCGKRLEACREPLSGTLMLGSDGTGLVCTIRPIGHSTVRHHRDGRCTRHVYVLLVSFLSPDGIVIPFHAEFIENGKDYNPEFDKQDCEHKAQSKLFAAINKLHPRLPVTMLMDALSLDSTQMSECLAKNWDFVISYKPGAVKGLADEIAAALAGRKDTIGFLRKEGKAKDGTSVTREYTWCKVTYKFGKAQDTSGFPVTYAKMVVVSTSPEGSSETKTYERITSHSLSSGNIEAFFDYMGGTRWCEENQGFNEMKNLGLNIEHAYGCRGEAVVNHFLLQMIAFVIMQLAGKTDMYSQVESLTAKSEGEALPVTDAECKKSVVARASPGKSMRRLFSSLFVIGRKFLKNLTSRVMRCLDGEAVANMRIRWTYG